MSSLSILIPARNEIFLARTIEDLLENIEGQTDIIVGLDGAWAEPGLPQHPKLTVVYYPQSIGQRALTNRLCKLSKAKYVMKVDAHTAWDKGFDVKLMENMQDDWTCAPQMRNLHAFNWVCPEGHSRYQGPSGPCQECNQETSREMVWQPRNGTRNSAYRFDKSLHFQYWPELKAKQKGDLVESLSLQGSCFMLTREKYWELDICDEKAGSWGHQGTEVALKTWLSGGKVIINKKTWYAHLFRTQGGDFSFPYKHKESDIEKTRQYFRDIFLEDKWPKAKLKLSDVLDKFRPVPEWHD